MNGYFASMPFGTYVTVIGRQRRMDVVRGILRRSKFISNVKNYSDVYLPYTIKSGDSPESVAAAIYGSPKLFWVVMLFNELHSSYTDWPMTDQMLYDFCKIQYPGTFVPDGETEEVPNMNKVWYYKKDDIVVGEFRECYNISTWVPPTNTDITALPVTFYEHEFALNEQKRLIRLLRPEMLNEFVTQFEQSIGGA